MLSCMLDNRCSLWANALLEAANKANLSTQYKKAIFLYEKALDSGANKAIVYFNLGNIYYHLNNPGKSIVYYQQVIAIAPQFKDSYLNLGKIFYLKEEYVRALNIFKKYVNINEEDIETWLLVGDVYKKLQRLDLSERSYLKAIAIDPQTEAAYIALISLYYDLNDYQNAFNYTEDALTYLPNNVGLLEIQADIHRQLAEYNEASAVYSYMLSALTNLDVDDKYRIYYQMVDNYFQGGYTNMAIYTLQETLKIYPSEKENL